ncbi:MAG: glycosyltransferase family 2 protein [Planctomycetes bacterium]|nr:glycosyltransferase family 2 protein [Planctomycetota bacterium]
MPPTAALDVSALVATKDRRDFLLRALKSIALQTCPPASIVVVNDGEPWTGGYAQCLARAVGTIPLDLIANTCARGAAGAWNSGLDHIARKGASGFVAILDDDDEWEPSHLEACTKCALSTGANIVVSGLRLVIGGEEVTRALPNSLRDRDFLVGNPGWQGSNTFVRLDLMAAVGGYREGLCSLNDRDLAIRLLRNDRSHIAYTDEWTAKWHCRSAGTLSSPRAPEKLSGLRWFWQIYGEQMNALERLQFFGRAQDLFGFCHNEIVTAADDLLPVRKDKGDWDAQAFG